LAETGCLCRDAIIGDRVSDTAAFVSPPVAIKNSGYGREGGRFSMEEMTELKWITVQRGQRAFPI
jgi:aldehyde dehydrogenase (NAD+)